MKKRKKIKIRKDWNGINPCEQVEQKKRSEDEPFHSEYYKGLSIIEEDLEDWNDFERGIK